MQLYLDMDGVLADFDRHYENAFGRLPDKTSDNVDWSLFERAPDFFALMPPMSDLRELWDFVCYFRPVILSGVPTSVKNAAAGKRAWVNQHLGADIPLICCRSRDKCLHAAPGDILVDDWEKYKDKWLSAGGRWVTHTSAKITIERLKGIL